jgi:hypothetical protein
MKAVESADKRRDPTAANDSYGADSPLGGIKAGSRSQPQEQLLHSLQYKEAD